MQQVNESRLRAWTMYDDGLSSSGAEAEERAGEYGFGTREAG